MFQMQQVFTPGAPVKSRDLFSGREQQLHRVIDSIPAPGRHPVIYGQRGVGKTSLANIITEVLQELISVRVSCDGSDDFCTIWNRVLKTATISFKERAFGFSKEDCLKKTSLGSFLGHDEQNVSPAQIAGLLGQIQPHLTIVILDEFDKVLDQTTKAKFADLIKILSDNHGNITLVLVGVAKNIGELIGQHPSIERNLVQIELPMMTDAEIKGILTVGCQKLGLIVRPEVLDEVALLSNGFPHFAHLLGLCAAKACIENDASQLEDNLFRVACEYAVQDSIEKYRESFSTATRTGKPSRYPHILCACAFALHDDRGVFRASDVVEAMRTVFHAPLSIQSVVPALGEFSSAKRGVVLEKVPVGKRSHYRFTDPMLRPFLRIRSKSLMT